MRVQAQKWHERDEELWEHSRVLKLILDQTRLHDQVCNKCGKRGSLHAVVKGWRHPDACEMMEELLRNKSEETAFLGVIELSARCTECEAIFWEERFEVAKSQAMHSI